jgi:hypothetical protein
MKLGSLASVSAIVGIGVFAAQPSARADFSIVLTNCNSSFNCSPATGLNFGTVKVTNDGSNTVKITVTLNSPYDFHETPSSGALDSFAFSLASAFGTGTLSNITSGWSADIPPQNTDGMGTFTDALTLSSNSPGPLVFDVAATGLSATIADFATGGAAFNSAGGYYFIADVICDATTGRCNNGTTNGATGLAGGNTAPVPAPILGAGLPGLLAACAGLVAFARRRRQKFA